MFAELALVATASGGTAAVAYANRLHRRLHTDPLTRLGNRDALTRVFRRVQRRAGRGGLVGLLLVDVDRFKLINDTHGHRTGDAMLTAIAADLDDSCRPGEVPIRLHGDEFAVLLTNLADVRVAELRARDLRSHLATTHLVDGLPLAVSVSIGAAVDTARTTTLPALLGHADTRMYGDKHTRPVTTLPTRTAAPTRQRDLPREAA
ncbi:GGDEF domain-containing protein [Saccharopolyspora gloriosae]|uniref:GGDEF domain-containing protein n=1 Tax=Saccharopolyspora gloriosae TaxID=455344 RepID=UPI001FB76EDE|nr:GGDEF domain-containing protein [Saccharopolyspora gloriosae]